MNSSDRSSPYRTTRVGLACFAALFALLVAVSPAAWGQSPQASADIQLTAGDGQISSDATSVVAEPGQNVVIEIFATGFTAQGANISLTLDDLSAILSDGPDKPSAASSVFPMVIPSVEGNALKFASAVFGPEVTVSGDPILLMTVTLKMAQDFKTLNITLAEIDFLKTKISPNLVLTVTNADAIPKTFSADLNPLTGNQERITARLNPAGRFPVQVFAGGLRNTTAFEIHIQFNPDDIVAAETGFVAESPFVTMPSSTGGAVAVEGNTLIVQATAVEGVTGTTPLGKFSFLTTSAFRGSELTFTKVVFTEGGAEKTLEPALVLTLGSVVIDAPIVTRPPIPITVTGTRAIIAWKTNKLATGKVLYGASAADLSLSATPESDDLTTSHSVKIEGLTPTTRYFYKVTATDAQQRTSDPFPATPASFFTKQADTNPPKIVLGPAALGITTTSAKIIMSMDEATTVTATYQELDQNNEPVGDALPAASTVPEIAHMLTLTDLKSGTKYSFSITPADLNGLPSVKPYTGSFRTLGVADTRPPAILGRPTVLGRTMSGAVIGWLTDEPSNSAVFYGAVQGVLADSVVVQESVRDHRVTLSNLLSETTYYLQVRSTDASGNPKRSDTFTLKTAGEEDATPPRIVRYPIIPRLSDTEALITWEVNEPGTHAVQFATSEDVYADETGAVGETVTIATPTRRPEALLTNLTKSTVYYYKVMSTDLSGNGPATTAKFSLSFATRAKADTEAPVVFGRPTVYGRTDKSTIVTWTADEPHSALVAYWNVPSTKVAEAANHAATTAANSAVAAGATPAQVTAAAQAAAAQTVTAQGGTAAQVALATTSAAATAQSIIAAAVAAGTMPSTAGISATAMAGIVAGAVASAAVIEDPVTDVDTVRVEDIELASGHDVTLSDLELGSEYGYRVTLTDPAENSKTTDEFKFKTLAVEDKIRPNIISGPVARNITSTSATIYWVTDEPADSRVMYGLSKNYTETVEDPTATVIHSITLTNLTLGQVYHYAVGSADQSGNLVTTDAAGKILGVSRDHGFITLAKEDELPPVIIEGPEVQIGNKVAVVRWKTDEAATSRVTIGVPPGSPEAELEGVPVFGQPSQLVFEPNNKRKMKHNVPLTELTGGYPYQFIVSSTDASGNTITWTPPSGAGKFQPPGGFGTFTTTTQEDTQFPVITSGPTVVANTASSLTIEWGTDEASNSVVNFGGSADALGSQEVSGDSETTHRMVLTKLAAGATYAFKVASTDISGNGATESQVAYATTAAEADLTAPVITSDPEIIYKTDRQATVKWITNEFSDAEVAYGASQDELLQVRTDPDLASEHTITLTNLDAGAMYYYKVSSKDQSNNGPVQSAVLSFTTESAPDTQVPVITDVAAVASDSTAVITWKTDELSDSAVRFGTSASSLDFNVGEGADVTEHRIVLSNLTPSTAYTFTVESIDRSDNKSEVSDQGEFTTVAAGEVQAPDAPTDLTASAGNAAVKLAWTASASAGVTGYTVERAAGDGDFAPTATLEAVTNYVDATVQNDTAYRYRILAVGLKQIASDPSTATDAVTPAAGSGPGAPTLFVTQGNPLTPTLVINNSTPLNPDDKLIYAFHISSQADFSDALTLATGVASGAGLGTGDPSGVTAWTVDQTLQDGATYYWRARSSDGTFDSAYLTGSFAVDANAPQYPGDFSGDMAVNFVDFLSFIGSFNKAPGDQGYNAEADFNGDGGVNFVDFLSFIKVFNKQYIRGATGKPVAAAFTYGMDASTGLQLVGRTVSSEKDAELAVDVMVSDAEDLRGYGLRIDYDPAVVQFLEATDGGDNLLKTDGRFAELFGTFSQDAETGEVFFASAITSGAAVEGDGRVARLRFRLLVDHPQGSLMHIAEGLLITGKLGADIAQNLGDHLNLVPRDFALERNFPNPFNPETTIRYAVPEAGKIAIRIYNVLGQEVATLVNKDHHPGLYAVRWNGQDRLGRAVASGIYLYRMDAGEFSQVHKMLLLK